MATITRPKSHKGCVRNRFLIAPQQVILELIGLGARSPFLLSNLYSTVADHCPQDIQKSLVDWLIESLTKFLVPNSKLQCCNKERLIWFGVLLRCPFFRVETESTFSVSTITPCSTSVITSFRNARLLPVFTLIHSRLYRAISA